MHICKKTMIALKWTFIKGTIKNSTVVLKAIFDFSYTSLPPFSCILKSPCTQLRVARGYKLRLSLAIVYVNILQMLNDCCHLIIVVVMLMKIVLVT